MRLETPVVLEGGNWQEGEGPEVRIHAALLQKAVAEAWVFYHLKRNARMRQELAREIARRRPEEVETVAQRLPVKVPKIQRPLLGRIESRWLWEIGPEGYRAQEVVALVDLLTVPEVWAEPVSFSALLSYGDALLGQEIRRARLLAPGVVPFLVNLKARMRAEQRALLRLGLWKQDPVPGWVLALRRDPVFLRWARKHRVFPLEETLWMLPETRETPGWVSIAQPGEP